MIPSFIAGHFKFNCIGTMTNIFLASAILLSILGTSVSNNLKCRTLRETMLSCINAKEDDIPKTQQPKLQWFTFSKSTIPKIKQSFMRNFPGLTDFHAENAGIEVIEDDAFKNQGIINWVDVSLNKLTNINPDMFTHSQSFEHFNISGNELVIPKNKPLLKSQHLRWLDISSNGIRELYPESLAILPKLRDLSLAHNLLQALPENIFKNNPGLLSLDITDNKITFLPGQMFQNFRTMVLRFEDNPWNCDCKLTPLIIWSKRNVVKGDVRCFKPNDKKWKEIANPQVCK